MSMSGGDVGLRLPKFRWRILAALVISLGLVSFLHLTTVADRYRRPETPETAALRPSLLPVAPVEADDDEYVAFCMSVKDQPLDLRESLVHHYHHLGMRRFYVLDDGSNPPLSTFDYGIPAAAVTHVYLAPEKRIKYMQAALYNTCHRSFGHKHRWLAFIDADEMFEMTEGQSFLKLLRELDRDVAVGALGVNWRTHTSSHLLSRPNSSRHSFTTCISDGADKQGHVSDNEHVKSIVKTDHYIRALSPHHFSVNESTATYGEFGSRRPAIPGQRQVPISRQRIALHHYSVKSKEEFREKMARSNGMDDPRGWNYWDLIESGTEHVHCPEMTLYSP